MRILLVEDEATIAVTLTDDLTAEGHEVEHVADGKAAIARLQEKAFDCVITDVRLPGADGMAVLAAAKQARPDTEVIVMTAYATIEHAVEAMRHGADDYIQKPFLNEAVVERLRRIAQLRVLLDENKSLKATLAGDHGLPGVIGNSAPMQDVFKIVRTVAPTDASVLITGESGTGKECIAKALHQLSRRSPKPFVALSCGALPETLLESELFGHEKGSFTGAHMRRRGRFELADGGTIFLDEITETSPALQVKLLRVLQDGTFERLGSEHTLRTDVRVIAACNKNLRAEVEKGNFRADLFYRLNGFPLTLPPLREREQDIPLLAAHFLSKHGYEKVGGFSETAMTALQAYAWPGNVRELENLVRRAAILAQRAGRHLIQTSDLPGELLENNVTVAPAFAYQPLDSQVLEMLRALRFSRSAISQTAKALGNRDRGTITEYLRGICFEHLVQAQFDVTQAARTIAASDDEQIIARVRAKIDEYLKNLNAASVEKLSKGLPQKYHVFLQQVKMHMNRST